MVERQLGIGFGPHLWVLEAAAQRFSFEVGETCKIPLA